MKYAFMTFSAVHHRFNDLLSMAKRLGYDGVEPRMGHAHGIDGDLPTSQRKEMKERSTETGIAICCLASGNSFAHPDKTENSVEEIRRLIEVSRDLGCPAIRVFGGRISSEAERAAATDRVAEALLRLADEAQAADVKICLETHDSWTQPSDVAAVMQRVNHPAIGVNWDILHPQRIHKIPMRDAYDILSPWIHHVHIHDATFEPQLVYTTMGEGAVDVGSALSCLIESNYNGYLSGEWIEKNGLVIDPEDELVRMKALEASLRSS